MAGTFGGYWQNKILADRLGQQTATQQTLFLALGTAAVFTAATNTFEPYDAATAGYARYPIGTNSMFETASVPAAYAGSVATNTATMTITAGALSNWGDIGWIALMNTSTVGQGNVLAWCTAAATRTVLTGDQVLIAAGSLTIQVGP